MTTQHNRIVKIFYSYAHKDKALRDELESHLESLRRSGQITTWYDREILPGMEWKREIDVHLNTSDIILLLISPSFMRSDYCFGVEMRRALERHKAGETHIIPIILRPVVWKSTPIGELQALPTEGKPITTWRNRDSAFQDVVKGVGTVVEMICSQAEREIGQGSTFSHQEEDAKIASNLENAAKTDHISNSPLQKSTPPDVYPQQQNIVSSASSSSQDRHKPISVSSRNSVHDRPRSHWKTILLTSIVIFIIFSGLGLLNLFHTNGNTTNNIRPTATSLTANSSGQTNGNQHLGLESHFTRFVLTVDVNGLLTDSQQAINAVKQQVQAQPALQNREVGLAIVYGGASNDSQISTALNVAQKVYAIFQALGQKEIIFTGASYYDPLFNLST